MLRKVPDTQQVLCKRLLLLELSPTMLLRKASLTSPSCQVAQPVARASVCNAELSPGINSALHTWRAQRYKDTPILIPLGSPGVQSEK